MLLLRKLTFEICFEFNDLYLWWNFFRVQHTPIYTCIRSEDATRACHFNFLLYDFLHVFFNILLFTMVVENVGDVFFMTNLNHDCKFFFCHSEIRPKKKIIVPNFVRIRKYQQESCNNLTKDSILLSYRESVYTVVIIGVDTPFFSCQCVLQIIVRNVI